MSLLQKTLTHINSPTKYHHHHHHHGQYRSLSIHDLLNEEPIKHNVSSSTTTSNSYSTHETTLNPSLSIKPVELPPINVLLSSPPPLPSTLHHRQNNNNTPTDIRNHSRVGIRKVRNGGIVVSSLEKAKRKRISPYQYQCLLQSFERSDSPGSETRERLAKELGMTKREVQVWFQNRRAKMNRCRRNHLKKK